MWVTTAQALADAKPAMQALRHPEAFEHLVGRAAQPREAELDIGQLVHKLELAGERGVDLVVHGVEGRDQRLGVV